MEMKVNQREDPYNEDAGREVRVICRTGTHVGVLQKIDLQNPNYYLGPFLINLSLPGKNRRWIDNYGIVKDCSLKIKKDTVECLEPLPTGYMERICEWNSYYKNYGDLSRSEKLKIKLNGLVRKLMHKEERK